MCAILSIIGGKVVCSFATVVWYGDMFSSTIIAHWGLKKYMGWLCLQAKLIRDTTD